MNQKRPLKMKALGDSISCGKLGAQHWEERAPELIKAALQAKFLQNPRLLLFLGKTAQRRIVECNPRDTFWGAGIKLQDLDAAVLDELPGKNTMGKLLMEVREGLDFEY